VGTIIYRFMCVCRSKLDLFLEGVLPLICTILLSRFHSKKRILSTKSDLRTVLEKASNGLYLRFNRRPKKLVSNTTQDEVDAGPVVGEEAAEVFEVVGDITLRFNGEGSIVEGRENSGGVSNDLIKKLQKTFLEETDIQEVHVKYINGIYIFI